MHSNQSCRYAIDVMNQTLCATQPQQLKTLVTILSINAQCSTFKSLIDVRQCQSTPVIPQQQYSQSMPIAQF
uniref:Uncharacterized protein n=1 Tax=Arundo donax TaxID=35708 RepID=A0A0A9HAJ5_ARUDO